MTYTGSLILPDIDPGIKIAHGGIDIGNSDPRFGEVDDVNAARSAMWQAIQLSSDNPTYAIKPLGGIEFVDVDTVPQSDRIIPSETHKEIDVTADAIITTKKMTGLMFNAADCIPLAVFEPETSVLAVIHLGWRGAVGHLHENVIDYATEQYGFDTETAVAYLGPSIHQKSFRTEELHKDQEGNPEWDPHIDERDDGFYIDLPGFVVSGLTRRGIKPQSIHKSSVDVGQPDSGHFSFTRHKNDGVPDGRNGFVVAMT